MLVLSRKESQKIRLGDSIMITVVRVTGDKVRIGIEAPRDMVVLRDELQPLNPDELNLNPDGLDEEVEIEGTEEWGQDSATPKKSTEHSQVGEKRQVSAPLAKDLPNTGTNCACANFNSPTVSDTVTVA